MCAHSRDSKGRRSLVMRRQPNSPFPCVWQSKRVCLPYHCRPPPPCAVALHPRQPHQPRLSGIPCQMDWVSTGRLQVCPAGPPRPAASAAPSAAACPAGRAGRPPPAGRTGTPRRGARACLGRSGGHGGRALACTALHTSWAGVVFALACLRLPRCVFACVGNVCARTHYVLVKDICVSIISGNVSAYYARARAWPLHVSLSLRVLDKPYTGNN